MSTPLVVAVTVVAALLALAGLASTAARRRIGLLHLALAGLLQALLVAQAVLAAVRLPDADLPDTATFLGYLAGALLLPVAGVLFSRTETSRWAGTVLAVPAAAVAVMVWRLLQLWEAGGG
ncbi:hypothetical protein [Trujillonella humicola]|uniref:hypothetical protein n=1 Tax=Trujillonella humicola TaxID=3383699 RepID=UPI0039064BE3